MPPTAYVKMIDLWLIFSLLKPFVDIIIQTFIETLRDNPEHGNGEAWSAGSNCKKGVIEKEITTLERMKLIRRMKLFLRVIYPTFCLLFIIMFWIIGLV